MSTLKERIAAAQELAVRMIRETEPEVSGFVAGAHVNYTATTVEPISVFVMTHFRSWHRYLPEGTFRDASVEEIAQRLIIWVRGALECGLLVAEDPPMAKHIDGKARLIDLMHARLAQLRGTSAQLRA